MRKCPYSLPTYGVAGVALGDIDVHSAHADARRGGKIQQPNNVLDSTKAKNHKENAANVCQHLGIPRFLMNHGQHRVQFCLILQCCWTPVPEGRFSALWLCPKYCKWNCSSVRLWLCMNLNWMQLNAPWFWGGLFLVLIYVQELTCQHFVHPEHHVWKLTCPRLCISATVATISWAARLDVATDSQHQVEARAGFGKETDSMERKLKISKALCFTH